MSLVSTLDRSSLWSWAFTQRSWSSGSLLSGKPWSWSWVSGNAPTGIYSGYSSRSGDR